MHIKWRWVQNCPWINNFQFLPHWITWYRIALPYRISIHIFLRYHPLLDAFMILRRQLKPNPSPSLNLFDISPRFRGRVLTWTAPGCCLLSDPIFCIGPERARSRGPSTVTSGHPICRAEARLTTFPVPEVLATPPNSTPTSSPQPL